MNSNFFATSLPEPNLSYLATLFKILSSKLCIPIESLSISPTNFSKEFGPIWFGSLSQEISFISKSSFDPATIIHT
jgi:hypothetical protein